MSYTASSAQSEHITSHESPVLLPSRRGYRWFRVFWHNPIALVGVFFVLFFALVALLAPVLAPPINPSQPYLIPRTSFIAEPQPPSTQEPFGTTQGQYSLYYGIVWGTRTALKVGLLITGLALLIGGAIGSICAYLGGWYDELGQRLVEFFMVFPFLLTALTLSVVLTPKLHNRMLVGIIALIIFGWPGYARLVRGELLSVKEREYILAARALGSPGWRILLVHIIPNSFYPLLVVAAMDIGAYVLTFAGLSFLGFGASEGYADWGQLLSNARNWIPVLDTHWWIVLYPGFALVLFTLGFTLIGDALRDASDPRLQGGRRS